MMKVLLIAPEIHEPGQVEAAWELQRSGLQVYPLTGEVTERQIAEQCQPDQGYTALIWLTHGGPEGVLLRAETGGVHAEPARWLPPEAVAAYAKAAEVRLVMLAVCQGRQLAREVYFRSGALVVYAAGDLALPTAYTLLASFCRRLRDGALEDALEIADALGLDCYPHTVGAPQGNLMEFLQQMTAMLTQRMDRLEARTQEQYEALDQRLGGVEGKLDELGKTTLTMTPARRRAWLAGAGLFAAPFALTDALHMAGVAVHWLPYLLVTIACLALAALLLLYGMGRVVG